MKRLIFLFVLIFFGVLTFYVFTHKDDESGSSKLSAEYAAASSSDNKVHITEQKHSEKEPAFESDEDKTITKEHYSSPNEEVYLDVPGGVFSIYPISPEQLYDEHVADAQSGNTNAQYQVAKALRECVRVPQESVISQLSESGSNAALVERLKAHRHYCQPLFERVPEPELQAQYLYWYEQALAGNNIVATAQHWFEHYEHFSQEKAKALLQAAIQSRDTDVYQYIATYTSIFFPHDETLADVWTYVGCVKSAACNEQQMLIYYAENISAANSEIVLKKALQILEQLDKSSSIDIDP